MNNLHETHTVKESAPPSDGGVPAFNNATEYYRNIVGLPNKTADLKSMPGPVRWFGYFFYGAIGLMAVAFVVTLIINH